MRYNLKEKVHLSTVPDTDHANQTLNTQVARKNSGRRGLLLPRSQTLQDAPPSAAEF
jgi:hypothetical protein